MGGGEMRKSSKYTICKSGGLSRCQVKYKISLTNTSQFLLEAVEISSDKCVVL